MKAAHGAAAVLLATLGVSASGQVAQERDANAVTDATFKDQTSYDLFRGARMAVGGEGAVVNLRSLRLTGRSRVRVEGRSDLVVEGDVEVRVLLPDHYVRIDSSGDSVRVAGYAGTRLLNMFSDAGELIQPPHKLRDALLMSERAHLARLMIGVAAWTSPHFALTFRSVGAPAEMVDPRVSAETVSVSQASRVPQLVESTGEHGFFLRLQLAGNRLPHRIEYRVSGSRQMTMLFEERRPASGLRLPQKITTSDHRGTVVDEMRFTLIEVNPPLTGVEFNPPGLRER